MYINTNLWQKQKYMIINVNGYGWAVITLYSLLSLLDPQDLNGTALNTPQDMLVKIQLNSFR